MRILVDAMGGDNAPDQIALGAIQAAKDFNCEVVLVGRGEAILRALKDQGIETLPKGVEIANADDVVDMHDDPATVVKKKKDSSMVVGLNMLKEGGGDAFVSAGSTGALLSAATLIVRRVKGIRRAAMGPQIPTKTGRECVLIDCGATADCTPEFLLQFAFMGSYYAEKVLGIENPRVALLNIGAEDSKGGELQKAVYPLLKQAGETGAINFTGNIEARDVPLGGADVVVADGFSGNILLKGIEGTALFMASMMKNMFKKNVLTKLAALLCMDGVKAFKKKMDYRETGGTALIGLSKPVIKAHGSSDALAIRNAIPTAEGCIGILLRESTRTLWGANILLLGFGPVGQALGVRLAALGADVTVCARRPEQRALAESLGLRGAELARLGALAPAFDRVVNTIPAPVLTEPVLTALRPGSLIVDLASKPGGTDFAAAQRLGLRAIHALSLPAVCAPETAGEAVARTVLAILREREECT